MTNSSHSFSYTAGAPAFLTPFPGQHWKEQVSCNARTSQELITEWKKESNILAKRKHRRKSHLNRVCYLKAIEENGSIYKLTGHPLCTALFLLDRHSQPWIRGDTVQAYRRMETTVQMWGTHYHQRTQAQETETHDNRKVYFPHTMSGNGKVFLTEVIQLDESTW